VRPVASYGKQKKETVVRNTYRAPGSDRIPCPPRRRAGFTMIEMLIVVVIIAILATLTLRVISGVQRRAKVAQEVNDIQQLGMAIQAFKDQFGIYPPSRIRLRENTPYITSGTAPNAFDQHSVQYLKRLWPNIQLVQAPSGGTPPTLTEAQCIMWCKDLLGTGKQQYSQTLGIAGNLLSTGQTYELEGDECLVFFLGGIAEFDRNSLNSGRPIILHGFSDNARNPGGVPNAQDPSTTNRVGPLYQFAADRLFVRNNAGSTTQVAQQAPNSLADFGLTTRPVNNKLPSYRGFQSPVTNPVPIAYFSAYDGQGYRPEDCAFPRDMVTDKGPTSTGSGSTGNSDLEYQIAFQLMQPSITLETTPHPFCWGPNPYTMTRSGPTSAPQDVETDDTNDPPDSLGALMRPYEPNTFQLISPGLDNLLGRGGKLPPSVPITSTDPSYDNISNVSGGQTVGAFAESKGKSQ
jgi:general secretion pathway protein G